MQKLQYISWIVALVILRIDYLLLLYGQYMGVAKFT